MAADDAGGGYGPLDALARLQSLQALLTGDVDGLLCIGGIDGGENLGGAQVLKYLLLGRNGSELLDANIGSEDFEDAVMVITKTAVAIYCNHKVFAQVSSLTALWRGLTTHVVSAQEMKDADAAEDFKIASFVSMVAGCTKFGISVGAEIGKGATSVVERWPLVQAYALQDESGGGGRGFFTMT